MSFYSPEIYVDVAKRWRGIGASYLLFLSVLFSIPLAVQTIGDVRSYFSESVKPSLKDMPTLLVEGGKASFYKKTPPNSIWVGLDNDKHAFFMIDLSDKVDDLSTVRVPILITRDTFRIEMKAPIGRPELLSSQIAFPTRADGHFNTDTLKELLRNTENNVLYSVYPIMVLLFWGTARSSLWVVTFLGQFLSYLALRYKVRFFQAMRLLIVAATPSVILAALFCTFHAFNLLEKITVGVLLCLYFLFAVRACRFDLSLERQA